MTYYTRKPIDIEALQWTGKNDIEMYNFLEGTKCICSSDIKPNGKYFYIDLSGSSCQIGPLYVKTLNGFVKANIGDYIIKGEDEYYPCNPEVLKKLYNEIDEHSEDDFRIRIHLLAQKYHAYIGLEQDNSTAPVILTEKFTNNKGESVMYTYDVTDLYKNSEYYKIYILAKAILEGKINK